jgi:hypothetical protein
MRDNSGSVLMNLFELPPTPGPPRQARRPVASGASHGARFAVIYSSKYAESALLRLVKTYSQLPVLFRLKAVARNVRKFGTVRREVRRTRGKHGRGERARASEDLYRPCVQP